MSWSSTRKRVSVAAAVAVALGGPSVYISARQEDVVEEQFLSPDDRLVLQRHRDGDITARDGEKPAIVLMVGAGGCVSPERISAKEAMRNGNGTALRIVSGIEGQNVVSSLGIQILLLNANEYKLSKPVDARWLRYERAPGRGWIISEVDQTLPAPPQDKFSIEC